jgi:hypothetical protein
VQFVVGRVSAPASSVGDVKRRPSPERSGPLAGHVRDRGVYRSPLAASGKLVIEDWVRDDLPDLLWPTLY